MLIDISDIISRENGEIRKQAEIGLTNVSCRLGEFAIVGKDPFWLTLRNIEKKLLKIEGRTEVLLEIPCDRCLSDVAVSFPIVIEKEFSIADLFEHTKSENEEFHYISGTELDVDQLIFGEILVNWPMKVLCKEDCLGICKQCGSNLNFTECSCQKTEPDVRMAVIQDIFNKFKEV